MSTEHRCDSESSTARCVCVCVHLCVQVCTCVHAHLIIREREAQQEISGLAPALTVDFVDIALDLSLGEQLLVHISFPLRVFCLRTREMKSS